MKVGIIGSGGREHALRHALKKSNKVNLIDLDNELISKPESREEALTILKKLNGKKHHLISSVCISKNGSMIWNYTDKAELTMKNFKDEDLKLYL